LTFLSASDSRQVSFLMAESALKYTYYVVTCSDIGSMNRNDHHVSSSGQPLKNIQQERSISPCTVSIRKKTSFSVAGYTYHSFVKCLDTNYFAAILVPANTRTCEFDLYVILVWI
jgi:hypothetical protein